MKKYLLAHILITSCFVSAFSQTTYVGAWNPVNYPAVAGSGACGWQTQDNAANGTNSNPYASWTKAWSQVLLNGTKYQTVNFLPDAYIQNYDYDAPINPGSDNCLGASLDANVTIGPSLKGLTITGSTSGCGTYVSTGVTPNIINFAKIDGADSVTIKDIYFKGFAQVLTIKDAQKMVISNCIFDNTNGNALDGILIQSLTRNTSVTFDNCKFLKNTGSNTTGAVKIESNSANVNFRAIVDFNNCEILCGSKDNSGGAIMITGRTVANALPTEINFNGATFANNHATSAGKGGALYIGDNCKVTITNAKFYNNDTYDAGGADGGGAIYIYSSSTGLSAAARTDVTITDSKFYGNQCKNTTSGGAIALQGASGHTNTNRPRLTLTNCAFERNKAASKGGAIYSSYGELNIDNCYFAKDTASSGGAIYVKNATSVLNLTNSTFVSDNGAGSGKDIYTDVDILTSSNSLSSAANVVGTPFPAFPAIDVFTRANNTIVGNSWTQTSGTSSVNTNHLLLGNTNDAFVTRTASGYNTTLTSGTDKITWAFNFYSAATSGTKYGFYVLAANSPNFNAATTNGYAVKFSSGGIKLISFTGGVKSVTTTTIVSGSVLSASQTASVRVIYNPTTDKWQLFDGTNAGDALGTDPRTGLSEKGTAGGTVNTTYVNIDLPYMGAFWTPNASGSSSSVANFDDIYQSVGTGIGGAGWTGSYSSVNTITEVNSYSCGGYCAMTVSSACLATQFPNVCPLPATGSVSGSVFVDVNGDGINNDGSAFANLAVILYDDNGNIIGRAFTDANGNYTFNGLPDGTYHVTFVPQSGNHQYATAPNASTATAATDSDINPNTFTSGPIVINSALGTTNSTDANAPAANFTNVTAGFRNTPIILPTELISFSGKIENCTENHLTWTTNHEEGISHFNVYERQENNEFTLLGKVNAAGNTTELKSYQYDNEQIKPISYYKLEVIDINQQMTNVNVIEVKNVCYEGITLLNNPVSDKVNLQFYNAEGNEAQVSIFDMSGKRMDFQTISVSEGLNHSSIKVENLPSGLYNLRIVYSNSAKVIRFIKE